MNKLVKYRIILIGVILVFFSLLMISFSFPDLFAMFYVPNLLGKGNIYSLVASKINVCSWLSATWPPLYYLTIGSYLKVIQFLGFIPKTLFSNDSCPVWILILNKTFLFWAKLPFLLLHFASAWLFSSFFARNKFLWFLFWLLNPVAIFINFIEGQFDIFPTFFLLAAFYFAKRKKIYITALLLGIGGAYKFYPFLLLVPFFLILTNNFKDKLIFIFLTLLPYFLTAILFINKDYLVSLSFSENFKMFETGFLIGNVKISIYAVLYMILIFRLIGEKQKNFETLINYSFLFTSIYFVTTFWFVQRLLFLLPSLLILSAKKQSIFRLLPFIYSAFFIYTLVLYPGLFDHTLLRPVMSVVPRNINYLNFSESFIKQIVMSLNIALFSWTIYIGGIKNSNKNIEVEIKSYHIVKSFLPLIGYFLVLGLLIIT